MIKHGTFKIDYVRLHTFELSRWDEIFNMFVYLGNFPSSYDAEQRIKEIKKQESLDEFYRKDFPKYYD